MRSRKPIELLLVALLFVITLSSSLERAAVDGVELRRAKAGVKCNGSIAECDAEEEFLMDSETHRRFLQQGNQISYGAINKDKPVCNTGGGQPYSGKCVPPRSGNPPSRGCNSYYQCRGGG